MTEARGEVLTVRVSRAQKKRIRRQAKKNGESVSALLLRGVEIAVAQPPQAAQPGDSLCITFRFREPGEADAPARSEAQRAAGGGISLQGLLVSCGE